jgi:hypothetical protein
VPEPLTFFVVGVPGSGIATVAHWFNERPDAFALVNAHRRPLAQLGTCCEKVARYWDGLRCGECPDLPPNITDALDIYGRFVLPLTEAHFALGGYAEEWHGELLDYKLLVRHAPLVDFWVCVIREPALCTRTGWPVGRVNECQQDVSGLAAVCGGIVVDGDEFADDSAVLGDIVREWL